jgi:recombination protein RecT
MTDQTKALAKPGEDKLKSFMRSDAIMTRFQEILGDRGARSYVSSVLLAVANNTALQECSHASIVASALRAATLSLSCDPAVGQAYLVPYGKVATFVVGYKGLRDMALRTNKYRFIHVDKVYQGEGVDIDRITGSAKMIGGKESDTIAGWVATFELFNGFRKTLYMTREEIHAHAKQYSKGYERQGGVWKANPAMMEKKTVLRQLLTHWGVLDARDELFMSAVDGAEVEDLGTIEATFVHEKPDPREDVSESDIMEELGYENVSRGESKREIESGTQETPAMTLKMAENVVNDKGVRYMDMPDDELIKAVQHLQQSIRTTTDTDRRVEQQFRLSAVNAIQLARKPTA